MARAGELVGLVRFTFVHCARPGATVVENLHATAQALQSHVDEQPVDAAVVGGVHNVSGQNKF